MARAMFDCQRIFCSRVVQQATARTHECTAHEEAYGNDRLRDLHSRRRSAGITQRLSRSSSPRATQAGRPHVTAAADERRDVPWRQGRNVPALRGWAHEQGERSDIDEHERKGVTAKWVRKKRGARATPDLTSSENESTRLERANQRGRTSETLHRS
jgi:hypothetical protein